MEFDKKTILAFLLIGLILMFMSSDFYKRMVRPGESIAPSEESKKGLVIEEEGAEPVEKEEPTRLEKEIETILPTEEKKSDFEEPLSYSELMGPGESVAVETDLYRAVFSTQGATLRSWTLKNYIGADSSLVQLVGEDGYGNFAIVLPTKKDTVDTSPFVFSVNKKPIILDEENVSDQLQFNLNLGENRTIKKIYTFYYDKYSVDLKVKLDNLDNLVEGFSYYLIWRTGIRSTEPNFEDDMRNAHGYALQGDLEKFDAKDKYKVWDDPTDWVALRTKYFSVGVIPEGVKGEAVRFFGQKIPVGGKRNWKKYGFDLQMPFYDKPNNENNFTLYLGPLDYDILRSYKVGLENTMNFGWAPIRPFSKLVLWSFKEMNKVIPNYGWVIVIFSILVKIILSPLTRKSYKSMKKMQALQPEMQRINEKYKNEPQKKQQELMKLYKAQKLFSIELIFQNDLETGNISKSLRQKFENFENYDVSLSDNVIVKKEDREWRITDKGNKQTFSVRKDKGKLDVYIQHNINPLGGCIPMLLQMPLLIALFNVFRSTIQLRGAPFIWWIKDLSRPDTVAILPFSVPLYGDSVNILPLFMGVTMFVQQKITMKDPKQKAMVYFMPVFFTLLFNSFPSGLNLYYALFNFNSIIIDNWKSLFKKVKEIYFNLTGRIYYNQKRYDSAIEAFDQVLALDRKNKDALMWKHASRGRLYYEQKQYEKAIEAFDRVLAVDKNNKDALIWKHSTYGRFYYERKQYDKAKEAWNEVGKLYYSDKQYDSAIEAFDQVLDIDKNNKDALIWKHATYGRLYYEQKQYDKAKEAWNELGRLYYDEKRYDSAIEAFDQVLALDRKNKDALMWKHASHGRLYYEQKQYEKAIEAFDGVLAIDKENRDALMWKHASHGRLYYEQKQYEKAVEAFDQVLTIEENDNNARYWKTASLQRISTDTQKRKKKKKKKRRKETKIK